MKELWIAGVLAAVMTLSGGSVDPPVYTTSPHEGKSPAVSQHEGFIPHERVTLQPSQDAPAGDGLLPDYGSPAYL